MASSLQDRFTNAALLRQALTHPSAAAEAASPLPDNQRLEYFGDAVLGLVAAEWLFAEHPEWGEGLLTLMRSRLASTETLARVARRLELPARLMLGKGEEKTGGREKTRILADALEAVLGAIWLDGGHAAAAAAFRDWFAEELAAVDAEEQSLFDPKGRLQELMQAARQAQPHYAVLSSEGPPHRPQFRVAVCLGAEQLGEGTGGSKRAAEAAAALAAIHTHFPSA